MKRFAVFLLCVCAFAVLASGAAATSPDDFEAQALVGAVGPERDELGSNKVPPQGGVRRIRLAAPGAGIDSLSRRPQESGDFKGITIPEGVPNSRLARGRSPHRRPFPLSLPKNIRIGGWTATV